MRYWIRHDKPAIAPGVCYGQLDVPVAVSPETTAVSLRPHLPPTLPVYSSPLRRCFALAQQLALDGQPPLVVPALQEVHFGRWEGIAWDEIPRHELDAWAANQFGYQFPEGESVPAFVARVSQAVAALPPAAVVVTHGGVIRVALHLAGVSLMEAFDTAVDYASITRLM